MSRVVSPSRSSPQSYGTISPEDVRMRGVADECNVSVDQDSSEESDGANTDEVTPLFAGPCINVKDNGLSKVVRRKKTCPDTCEVRCYCHEPPKPADKTSRNRLIIASIVVLVFMIGEVVGSLA